MGEAFSLPTWVHPRRARAGRRRMKYRLVIVAASMVAACGGTGNADKLFQDSNTSSSQGSQAQGTTTGIGGANAGGSTVTLNPSSVGGFGGSGEGGASHATTTSGPTTSTTTTTNATTTSTSSGGSDTIQCG